MTRLARAATLSETTDHATHAFPPMDPKHLAAHLRLARDPHVFDGIEKDWWVAFSGEHIVSAGPDLVAVVQAASEAGEDEPLIVPPTADILADG